MTRKVKRMKTVAKLSADIACNAVEVHCVRERFGKTYCRVVVNREVRSEVMPEEDADSLARWTIDAIQSVVHRAEEWRRKRKI